jgi:hypothetical protein
MNRMQKLFLAVLMCVSGFVSTVNADVQTRPPKPHHEMRDEADDSLRPVQWIRGSDNPR